MLRQSGLLLAIATMFLQIAVFLQPLLPEQYQIAPVCETVTHSIFHPEQTHIHHHNTSSFGYHFINHDQMSSDHDHHDANHQCQYCTVYGNLILPPELGVKEVLVRIQVRLLAFAESFKHVYFALQRLFLIPQGRAPPFFA